MSARRKNQLPSSNDTKMAEDISSCLINILLGISGGAASCRHLCQVAMFQLLAFKEDFYRFAIIKLSI